MFSDRLDRLERIEATASLRAGLRGLEKETLRVDRLGRIAQTAHPRGCGSALTHPRITTDYSEALLELVTAPLPGNWQTLQQLFDIHAFVHRETADELLWPMSMPGTLDGAESIPIADYGPSNRGMFRTVYRRGLGHRYGRPMQAIAGVHFNYSPPSDFWPRYSQAIGSTDDLQTVRSDALMGLVRNYYRWAWLVTYLFGASPACDRSFLPRGHTHLRELDAATWFAPYATSLRMSDIGYQNTSQARVRIGTNSLSEYVAGLTEAVTSVAPQFEKIGVQVDGEYRQLNANRLQIENEYYSTIRPKPAADGLRTTAGLRNTGVTYVEVRTLDLSPADPVGVNQAQLRFIEVLLLFCLLSESPPIDADEQNEIGERDVLAAREGRRPGLALPMGGRTLDIPSLGRTLATPLLEVAAVLDADSEGSDEYAASVRSALAALESPQLTPSARLLDALQDNGASFVEYGREVAAAHRDYFADMPFDADKLATEERMAAESLEAAAALEAAETQTFSEYLEDFMRGA